MSLQAMRGDCSAGDAPRLFGPVDMEAGSAALGTEEAAKSHIDQLAAAQR